MATRIASFVEKHDYLVTRILEIIPGISTWFFITSPIWLGYLYPRGVVFITIFVTLYWFYLAVKGFISGIKGYKQKKKEMATDWQVECQKLDFANLPEKSTLPPSLDESRHFVLMPAVNEPDEVLWPAFEALLNQTYSTQKIIIVYTVEEKYSEDITMRLRRMTDPYRSRFEDIKIFVHKAGIPGEAIGAAAANRTWGAKHAVLEMQNEGKIIRNYIFTTIDCDHVIDRQFLARLTHLYLSSDHRDLKYYSSSVYLFNNNLWRVPALMRIETYFITLGTLGDWALSSGEVEFKDTFSNYSASLQTLINVDYWDVSLGVDDTIFYWRAFIKYGGEFKGVSHFIPFSSDAVEGKNYVASYKSLYKQLLRWGYGVIDFPLSMKEFLVNDRISFSRKLTWFFEHIRKRVLLTNTAYMLTFGFSLATAVNPEFRQSVYANSVPAVTSFLLTITMVFLLPAAYLRKKLSAPMPAEWPWWKKLIILVEIPLMIVNLLTFSFIPFIDAQTRVMLGKKLKNLYHTPKVR